MTTSSNKLAIAVAAVSFAISGCDATPAPPPGSSVIRPVVYFQRAPVAGWQAVDWQGALHGSIGSDHVGIPYQSPDGSRIAWSPEGVWQIVDKKGNLLSRPDLTKSRSFTWADDSSGICVLNVIDENPPNGGSYRLEFDSATGGARTIATLTTSKGPNVAACSPRAGHVVVTTASGFNDSASIFHITFGQLSVVDFATGRMGLDQRFPTGDVADEVNAVTVSHDGALAAVATPTQTTIESLANGAVMAHTEVMTPLAFSWDGKEMAADTGSRGEVLSVTTGQVVWRDALTNRVTQGAVPDPGGPGLLLVTTTGGLNDLVVLSAAGIERTIAKEVFLPQIAPCSNCSAF